MVREYMAVTAMFHVHSMAVDVGLFVDKVNHEIKAGWQPIGSPTVVRDTDQMMGVMMQAMVKYEGP
jgi:hypothetical protein